MAHLITLILCSIAVATASPINNDIVSIANNTNGVGVAGLTALHKASEKGDRVGVKMLIAAGASVHDTDRDGSTSLHKAADKGRDKVALMLIENGANIDSRDLAGLTPLHRSVYKGHENVVKLLIDSGANVNTAANDGSTPLHTAFQKGNTKLTQTLIKHGADMTTKNGNGENVIDMALEYISRGVSTIWFGVWELAQRIVGNPSEAVRKSNLSHVNIGSHLKISFADQANREEQRNLDSTTFTRQAKPFSITIS